MRSPVHFYRTPFGGFEKAFWALTLFLLVLALILLDPPTIIRPCWVEWKQFQVSRTNIKKVKAHIRSKRASAARYWALRWWFWPKIGDIFHRMVFLSGPSWHSLCSMKTRFVCIFFAGAPLVGSVKNGKCTCWQKIFDLIDKLDPMKFFSAKRGIKYKGRASAGAALKTARSNSKKSEETVCGAT